MSSNTYYGRQTIFWGWREWRHWLFVASKSGLKFDVREQVSHFRSGHFPALGTLRLTLRGITRMLVRQKRQAASTASHSVARGDVYIDNEIGEVSINICVLTSHVSTRYRPGKLRLNVPKYEFRALKSPIWFFWRGKIRWKHFGPKFPLQFWLAQVAIWTQKLCWCFAIENSGCDVGRFRQFVQPGDVAWRIIFGRRYVTLWMNEVAN
jgi:hypothetical protein